MSEKGKEIDNGEVEEGEIIKHWSHDHPLTLVETRMKKKCYGCERYFTSGEQAYGCNKCEYKKLLHEECAKMGRKIRHPQHSQHILIQQHGRDLLKCQVCMSYIYKMGYKCSSSGCKFEMHVKCAIESGTVDDVHEEEEEERLRTIRHPSHPKHELRFFGRMISFKCDACGDTTGRGSSYKCSDCEYWIHERCASLNPTLKREDHHHSLSLSFQLPPQYIRYHYKCEVCNKYMLPKYWIYHCQLCGYVVHLKCAFKTTTYVNNAKAANEKGTIQLPISDMVGELIRPFVVRQGVQIPPIPHGDIGVAKYKFHCHEHKLTLFSSSPLDDQNKTRSGEADDNEDDIDDYGKRSELTCDGCISPIFPSSSSTSSSSLDEYYYYMRCSECKYVLHLECFYLPPQLPSLPLHEIDDHKLVLKSSSILESCRCDACGVKTNRLFYACTECSFEADIRCASLPGTLYHAAHPQHLLKYSTADDIRNSKHPWRWCAAAYDYMNSGTIDDDCYACESCEFAVHVACAMMPASVKSRRWDKKHPLLLTYDANLNHPDEFYCDECEDEMNPKSWMYHCRHCDLSFDAKCFHVAAGLYRTTKFGQEYSSKAHLHTLTYQLLTTKTRCDHCHRKRHLHPGFYCASCNFFICFKSCGKRMLKIGDIEAAS